MSMTHDFDFGPDAPFRVIEWPIRGDMNWRCAGPHGQTGHALCRKEFAESEAWQLNLLHLAPQLLAELVELRKRVEVEVTRGEGWCRDFIAMRKEREALRAENARLKALVESAYQEGWRTMRGERNPRNIHADWEHSDARAEIDSPPGA